MQSIKNKLEKNGFEVIIVDTKDEALHVAKNFVKKDMKIGLGGSTTVLETGLLEYLVNLKNITLFNQYESGIDMAENLKRRREGILSDLYVTGCNAITRNGELVNADGSGNRVAAQIFGPKKVLLLVGKNKIVDTLKDGFKRIKEVASVKNINRMNKKALELGKEPKYNLDNIGNKFAYINADEPGRTTIVLINEELGY
ncbi:lactate utilization protein [Sulfurospirillum arcachonense]|uniref:lactate utilization protein n=1 Tax=Sulfurospirillum arcachonense TaxID=57666 RepID=UPI00046A2ACF|nr:lactate utilization protein [Sulfurospirillum arcachonense]